MTTKLTLTIEDNIINSAKKYARRNGKSLSGMVENYLKTVTALEKNDMTAFSPKVMQMFGAIKLPEDFDYKKELADSLAKKYK